MSFQIVLKCTKVRQKKCNLDFSVELNVILQPLKLFTIAAPIYPFLVHCVIWHQNCKSSEWWCSIEFRFQFSSRVILWSTSTIYSIIWSVKKRGVGAKIGAVFFFCFPTSSFHTAFKICNIIIIKYYAQVYTTFVCVWTDIYPFCKSSGTGNICTSKNGWAGHSSSCLFITITNCASAGQFLASS